MALRQKFRYYIRTMFENAAPKTEDIFADTDAGAVPQVAPPTAKPPAAPMPAMPAQSVPVMSVPMPEMSSGGGFPWKPLVIVLAIIVVVGAAAGISWVVLSSKSAPTEMTETPTNEVPATTTTPTPTTAEQPTTPEPTQTPPAEEQPVVTPPAVEEKDTDKDGLSDTREAELGTSPTNSDTDADGLFDKEEVDFYHTNPLNPDTDGDGYKDGDEVKNGYNPSGPGKLLEVPQS